MQDFSYHHDLDAPFFGNRAHKEILKVENPLYQGGQSQKETFKVDSDGFSPQDEETLFPQGIGFISIK